MYRVSTRPDRNIPLLHYPTTRIMGFGGVRILDMLSGSPFVEQKSDS